MKSKRIMIDPSDDDFETICICAVRYSLGRETYIPTLVQDFIRPLLPYFSFRALRILERDLLDPISRYGNEKIDKPPWLSFLEDIKTELTKREV